MSGVLIRLGVLACVVTLALASCGDNGTAPPTTDRSAPSTADSMESAAAIELDRVVAVYNSQERYVAAAREKPDAALPALYTEYVVDPYWEACFSTAATGADVDRAEFGARITLSDTDRLGASAETLRTADATETVAAALAEARISVDTPPVTICVMAGYPATRFARLLDKTGAVMTTTSDQTVVMAVNPEVDGWQALMGYAAARDGYFLAQENCCWGADQVPTLLEAIVSIGKAHTFGKLLYPEASSPQTDALSPQQEAAQWKRMSSDLTSRNPELIEKYPSSVPPACRDGLATRSATTSSTATWRLTPKPPSTSGHTWTQQRCSTKAATPDNPERTRRR